MHVHQRGLNSECPRKGRYRRPRAASTLLCSRAVGKAARNRGAPSMVWKDRQTLNLEGRGWAFLAVGTPQTKARGDEGVGWQVEGDKCPETGGLQG